MELQVFNGEKFERGKVWYVIFAGIFIVSIVVSILSQNIIGAIVLFFILGAYLYYSTLSNQKIKIRLEDEFIIIDKTSQPRNHFTGYSLEIDKKTKKIKNIVFIDNRGYAIYTIKDKEDQIKEFAKELSRYIPIVNGYNQSFLERLIRLLKL